MTISLHRDCCPELLDRKYCVVEHSEFDLTPGQAEHWNALKSQWGELAPDKYYGGEARGHRTRRYSRVTFDPKVGEIARLEHVPYFQSPKQNRFVGGKIRRFEPVTDRTFDNPFFRELIRFDFEMFRLNIGAEWRDRTWVAEVHQIYIAVAPGQTTEITPEGIHTDGYPFASVHLIHRENVTGAESTVFDAEERPLQKVVFQRPLDSLFFEDRALKHYVTPITTAGPGAARGILAISFWLPDSPFTVDV